MRVEVSKVQAFSSSAREQPAVYLPGKCIRVGVMESEKNKMEYHLHFKDVGFMWRGAGHFSSVGLSLPLAQGPVSSKVSWKPPAICT